MNKIQRQSKVLFWAIGALERLQGLGFVSNTPMFITADAVHQWMQIDEEEQDLLKDDEMLASAVSYVVTKGGMTDPASVLGAIELVFDFRDNRKAMVSFALERIASA